MNCDFKQFFDDTAKEILEKLEMHGKINYSIIHYMKGKSKKKECYISKESDFINISIKLTEYNQLIKSLAKSEAYGIGNNSKRTHSKLMDKLRQLNFPERYLYPKILQDCIKFGEQYQKEQSKRILVEWGKIIDDSLKNIENMDNKDKATEEYVLIPYKCISTIIKKKLVTKDEMVKYADQLNQVKITKDNISQCKINRAREFIISILIQRTMI